MKRIKSIAGFVSLVALCISTPQALFAAKPEQKKPARNDRYHHASSSSSCSSSSFFTKKPAKAKSLACDHASLSQQLLYPKTTPAPIQVSRDEYNGIEISGGTFAEMYYHLGYQMTVDRLWQFYFNVKALNGELATILGAAGIANDRAIRRTTYTDAEFLAQYANFSDIAQTAIDSQVNGINQRISDVLVNPALLPAEFTVAGILPAPITKAEYLRYIYNVLRQNGGETIEGNNQLTFLSQLGNLVASGKTLSDAQAILSDVYSMRKKRSYGIAEDTVETLVTPCLSHSAKATAKQTKKQTGKQISASRQSAVASREGEAPSDEPMDVAEFLDEMKALEEQRDELGIIRFGSSSFVISGKYTDTGKPMMNGSPQLTLTTIPGAEYYASLKNDTLKFTHQGAIFPGDTVPIGVIGSNGYLFTSSTMVGSLPGLPTLLQPTPVANIPPPIGANPGPNTIFYLRTETILVKGGPSVTQDVHVFIPVGASVPEGFVTNLALSSPAGSGFWTGTQAVVVRNLDYMDDVKAFDTYILTKFSRSFAELEATVRGPGWSTVADLFQLGHDNQDNIFAYEAAGWYDFDTTSDLYPQGILGNPIPPKASMPKRTGYFIANPKKGFVLDWNTALTQNMPSVYSDAEENRVEWPEKLIKEIISTRKFTWSDTQTVRLHQGNGVNGANRPFNITTQNYSADAFHNLFKKRFFQAIDSVAPTANSILAHSLLDNFQGYFIDGSDYDVINSPQISDAWILAQRWGWEVQKAIVGPTFGAAYAGFTTSSALGSSNLTAYNRQVQALIARLLGTGKVFNPVNYPNWLANTGSSYDTIIINALNTAISALGPQPWGTGANARPKVTYTDTGGLLTVAPWNGNNPYILNRALAYFYTRAGNKGIIDMDIVLQIGQSGFITGPVGGPYVLADTVQQDSYLRFEGVTKPTVVPPKSH